MDWIGLLCIAGALSGAIYACISTWAMRAFVGRKPIDMDAAPSVAVLKPLRGDEPGLYESLCSFCTQDYPGRVQIIFGVQDPDDPAIKVVQRLRRNYPMIDIDLTLGAPTPGGNRKIANLVNMAPKADAEIIVISDSDVRVGQDHLRRVVSALQQPDVGLVNCLYRGQGTGSIWSFLAAMDVNYRFAPSVVVGHMFALADPCLGPTMALRRTVLEEIGGFPRLLDVLADDFELGRLVREAGLKVAFSSGLIDHRCSERSLRDMLVHEFRWARTVRLIEPAGYLGSIVTHFFMLALIGALFLGLTAWSLWALGVVCLLRLALADRLGRYAEARRSDLFWVFFRDLLSFVVFVAAFFGNKVEWRGTKLQVSRAGEISALPSTMVRTAAAT